MVPCNVELFTLFELLVALERQAFMDDDELTQMPKKKVGSYCCQARWATNQLAHIE